MSFLVFVGTYMYVYCLSLLELKWIETVYDIDQCISWMDHAKQLQAQVWSCHFLFLAMPVPSILQ